ncbi:hypothetical protein [Vibrio rotiferianus]|uniref:hypothetical protein n=1 Tax=Vibrio rotiferianus TaxID=190895 RepID=UPI000B5996E4|nr:hypothetical protein [Vibrio rotiferianus]ASI96556.1 hypothetical protein BSZ04_16525 [Vibrio rotiferianus]
MIETLSHCLEWNEASLDTRPMKLPESGERVLAYLPEYPWFTMVTFFRDETGPFFVVHCIVDYDFGMPSGGSIIDVGEKKLFWTRLSPELPFAKWGTEIQG